jgi:hypothetical protein
MRQLASGAAVAITVFGTAPYLVGTLRGQIRPHAITWLVWTVTTFIAFVGQLVGGGGVGAAAAGASAVVGAVTSGYAFWHGDRSCTCLDRLTLAGAGLALFGWALADGPLAALMLIAVVDAIGAVPTIHKAFLRPTEEGISAFVLANVKWLLALCALEHLNLLTLLFPATTCAVNTTIIVVVLVRRAQTKARSSAAARAERLRLGAT